MKTTSDVITYFLVSAVLTGFFASASFVKTDLGAEVKGADVTSPHSHTTPLIDMIKSRYEEVTRAVLEGKLPGETGKKADDLWISVQKYMIQMDARIDSLKLEAREYVGPRREEALNHLVVAGAERERALMGYLQALEKLSGRLEISKPPPQKPVEIPDPEKAAKDYEETRKKGPADYPDPEKAALETGKKKKKGLDLEIIIEPEDITKEEQDMD